MKVQPLWEYTATPPIANSASQMIIWNHGMGIWSFNNEGTICNAQFYFSPQEINNEIVENIISKNSAPTINEQMNRVWIMDSRAMTIPNDAYSKTESLNWFSTFHHIDKDEKVLTEKVLSPEAYFLFPLKENIELLINNHFPHSSIHPITSLPFSHSNKDQIIVAIVHQIAFIYVQVSGKVYLHQSYSFQSAEDLIYILALLGKQHNIDIQDKPISIMGINEHWESIHKGFISFFRNIQIEPNNSSAALQLLKSLSLCAL